MLLVSGSMAAHLAGVHTQPESTVDVVEVTPGPVVDLVVVTLVVDVVCVDCSALATGASSIGNHKRHIFKLIR